MKKSVYSLMLFEEIVEEIDHIAVEHNTNRSQLINDILADYLGLMTPEQKIQRILQKLKENFQDRLSISQMNKNSSIHFGKNIKYKYRPKIKYSYEFSGTGEKKYAVLKISSRSKSVELNQLIDTFFSEIADLERRNNFNLGTIPSNIPEHKFIREFKSSGSVNRDINDVTKFLTNYLNMVDEALNLFFSDSDHNNETDLQSIFDQFFRPTQLQIKTTNPIKLYKKQSLALIKEK